MENRKSLFGIEAKILKIGAEAPKVDVLVCDDFSEGVLHVGLQIVVLGVGLGRKEEENPYESLFGGHEIISMLSV